jgi:hypothetical protein
MAVRDDFAPGEVLAAADLNDTFASKLDTTTASTTYAPLASPTFTGTPALPFGTTLNTRTLGGWTSFTPSWTNFTVGNGSTSGFYVTAGKIVWGYVQATLGSTSSMGTSPRFAPPVGTVSGNMPGLTTVGWCYLQDTGVTIYTGFLNLDSGGFRLNSQTASTDDTRLDPVTSTNPMTWTNTDALGAYFQYQID